MFITRSNYRSPVPSMFASVDEQMWEATELALQRIWFVANLEVKDDGEEEHSLTSTVLLMDFKMVEPFLQSGQEGTTRLAALHIVTPGYLNGQDSWHMERLRAVWQGHEMVDDQVIPTDIYETVSGKKYPAAFCHLKVEELVGGNTLRYRLPH